MKNLILINNTKYESRVAIIENGQPVEIHIEQRSEMRLVGNIYKGEVVRVLPGMQAAFVDIGLERAAFLYVDDIVSEGLIKRVEERYCSEKGEVRDDGCEEHKFSRRTSIEKLIKEKDKILVQIVKDPISTKGARVTTHITLPGRFVVFMPTIDHVGVSHKIADQRERERLRGILTKYSPPNTGFIARTNTEDVKDINIIADMELLIELWNNILKKYEKSDERACIHRDFSLPLRIMRDYCNETVNQIVVDDRDLYREIREFTQLFMPSLAKRIKFYDQKEPLFKTFGIENAISRLLERRVWLRSGGYIVIDQAEALTVIDVNTGKYVGKRNLEETITRINLEAATEIAYQLRLRNIGGIIIIDFIDMNKPASREKVLKRLEAELKHDRVKTTISSISELGLVEMTRKRTTDSIVRQITEPCQYCEGRGFIKSRATVSYEVLREIERAGVTSRTTDIMVKANPTIVEFLHKECKSYLEEIEKKCKRDILIEPEDGYYIEQFEVTN